MSKIDENELDALVAWAASDEPTKSGVTTATGEDAARQGRTVLRMAGRPTLGHASATGEGRGPRRQVRLPQELNAELDRFAHQQQTSASEIIRLAVSEYIYGHQG